MEDATSSQPSMIRVLLVEDNMEHAFLAQRGLSGDHGFQVDHVRTGAQAMEAVRRTTFDVILLDYRLPDCEGINLCRRLRDSGIDGLILLVTGVGREALVDKAFEAGADDYIVKGPGFMERIADEVRARVEGGAE